MSKTVYLVRHPQTDPKYQGTCLGQTEMTLADSAVAAMPALVAHLKSLNPTTIVSSDLTRCLRLAEALGVATGLAVATDPRLRERHFGTWEGRPWQAIFEETGDEMDGLMTATWAPPGGESNAELVARVRSWLADCGDGVTVAVTHGGPIAALVGSTEGYDVAEWASLVPPPGSVTELEAE